jgi:hypothetical protein
VQWQSSWISKTEKNIRGSYKEHSYHLQFHHTDVF